jgi:hypothetical protein
MSSNDLSDKTVHLRNNPITLSLQHFYIEMVPEASRKDLFPISPNTPICLIASLNSNMHIPNCHIGMSVHFDQKCAMCSVETDGRPIKNSI